MGDSENALPPSKKRVAGRELSRDNPGLDDEEEEVFDQEAGFKKASEEVLANRRIVKVRRNRRAPAPSAPSSNPFASIRLVPPTEPIAASATFTNAPESEKTAVEVVEPQDNENKETEKEEEGEEAESKVNETESKPNTDEEKHEAENKDEVKEETKAKEETECETKNETETNEVENDEKKNTEAVSVNSFQQLSSSQNAFTGIVGTGFSSSSFSTYMHEDKADKSWFKRNAESIDLIVEENDSEEERVNSVRKKKASSAKIKNLQQKLSSLLSRPLQPRSFSSKFLPGHAARLDSEIIYDRYFDYDYFGFKTLERSYLLKIEGKVVERPQHMLMRVAVGIHKDDIAPLHDDVVHIVVMYNIFIYVVLYKRAIFIRIVVLVGVYIKC